MPHLLFLCLSLFLFAAPVSAQPEPADSAGQEMKIDSAFVEQADILGEAQDDGAVNTSVSFQSIGRGLLGLLFLLGVCWLLSASRRRIDWKLVGVGIGLQLVLAILVLKVEVVREGFSYVAGVFVQLLSFAKAGAIFLFGANLVEDPSFGAIFAFQILPTIVFFSAVTSIFYYLGVLQKIVFAFAWIMHRTMRLSGAESLAAAANIFVGQTEAPLVVKPYLDKMTKSEIMCLMTGGMATIAGGVLAAYIAFLGGDSDAEREIFATHLLTASIMSAPAAIVAAKMLFPETAKKEIDRSIEVPKEKVGKNLLDAISIGTTDGLRLAVNVGAMLLTFIALIYGVNYILGWFGTIDFGGISLNERINTSTGGRFEDFSLDYIFGMIFAPLAWIIGTPWADALLVGQLLGVKTVINEFVAYENMHGLMDSGLFLHDKSIIIATYALCGFANFSSIGIQIGGIGALAPSQRTTLAMFGIRALIGGTVACFLTATIAGMLY